jgi:ribonuclease-3
MSKKKVSADIKNNPPLEELLGRLRIKPTRPELFQIAFTHSSYGNERGLPYNERLEFLGDSVIAVIVCQYLYFHYPKYSEGKLAKLKSTIVSTKVLEAFAIRLGLNDYLRLGHGERKANGRNKKNLIEDLFEAFIGAYYINFGLEATAAFLIPLIEERLPELIRQTEAINSKTTLQEWAQAKDNGSMPEYRLLQTEGPPHDRTFTVEVFYRRQAMGRGTGKSVKAAENMAAVSALKKIEETNCKLNYRE